MSKFKPFELKINVTSESQLKALWIIANSDLNTKDFLNRHPQTYYFDKEEFNNPIGRYWVDLNKKVIEFEIEKHNK